MGSLGPIVEVSLPLIEEIHALECNGVDFEVSVSGAFLVHVQIRSILTDWVKAAQREDPKLLQLMDDAQSGNGRGFTLSDDRVLWLDRRLYVPNIGKFNKGS